jgi:ketosteroid isomerase-like protein
MPELDTAVAKLQASYASAALQRDAEAFMRLYDPTVRVFDTWGVWEYKGAELWRRAVEGWFVSLGTERVKVTFSETESHGSPAMAITSAIVTYASLSVQGEEVRSLQNRLTWGLRTTGHVLRIIHEHTSAPIGFEDMKAIMQRHPST